MSATSKRKEIIVHSRKLNPAANIRHRSATFKKTKPGGQYQTPLGNLKASCPNITADLIHAITLILDKNVKKILFGNIFCLLLFR